MTGLLWALALLLVLVGIVGALVPILPGAALVFIGLVLGAWADGFARVGAPTLLLLALLTATFYVVDILSGSVGARRTGASRRAVLGAALGTLVGLFFGIPGIILGPFLGAVAGEYSVHGRLGMAGKAGIGTWLGLVVGTAAKISILFVMLGIFALALLY